MFIIDENKQETIEKLDFSKINLGNQILIINKENNEISNTQQLILKSKYKNYLYTFANVDTNIKMKEDYSSINFNINEKDQKYLYFFKGFVLNIDDYYIKNKLNNYNLIKDLIKINKLENINIHNKYNIEYITCDYILPFNDFYLYIKFNYEINFSKYEFKRNYSIQYISIDIQDFIDIEVNIKTLLNTLNKLKIDKYIYNKLYQQYKLYSIRFETIINKSNFIQDLFILFNKSLNIESLKKLFSPVYVDTDINFKCYFDCFNNNILYDYDRKKYGYKSTHKQPLYDNIRISEAIVEQIKTYNLIDIYTGTSKNRILYKDLNYVVIPQPYTIKFFIKIKNIFVSATKEEQILINERWRVAEKMSKK